MFGLDAMLDNIMLYWLTRSGASSARLYWESTASGMLSRPIGLPVAATIFPHDLLASPRRWAERLFADIVYWNEPEVGGHFAAFEQPALFVAELRAAFRGLRSR